MTLPQMPPQQVGMPVDKTQIDMNAGNLARQIETWATSTLKFKAYLDSTTDAVLEAPPFGYTADNVALLKSAFDDLSLLARIYQGTDVLATERDLGTFSRRLAGIVI